MSVIEPMTADEFAALRRVVSVRPLDWTEYERDGVPDTWDAEAKPFGVYFSIELHHDGYRAFWDGQAFGPYDTLELAKAAAQADYERRILSALTSRAIPVAPDVEGDADAVAGLVTANDEAAAVKVAVIALASRIREQAKRDAYAECAELLETAALAAGSADAAASAEMIKALAEKKP